LNAHDARTQDACVPRLGPNPRIPELFIAEGANPDDKSFRRELMEMRKERER
jgi:hypothetical protein